MAKRFTDSDKWKKPWFRRLPNEAKLFWIYLLDQCNNAGIYPVDLELAEFCLGFEPDIEPLKSKIIVLSESKWFIPGFIDFQYGPTLNPNNKAHKSAIDTLKKEGAYKLLVCPSEQAKDKEKDKDKAKDKTKDKEKAKATKDKNDSFRESLFEVCPLPKKFECPESREVMLMYFDYRRRHPKYPAMTKKSVGILYKRVDECKDASHFVACVLYAIAGDVRSPYTKERDKHTWDTIYGAGHALCDEYPKWLSYIEFAESTASKSEAKTSFETLKPRFGEEDSKQAELNAEATSKWLEENREMHDGMLSGKPAPPDDELEEKATGTAF